NREVLEKRLIDLHAIFEIPKGDKHPDPYFRNLPEIESFAQSDGNVNWWPCSAGSAWQARHLFSLLECRKSESRFFKRRLEGRLKIRRSRKNTKSSPETI